ncbi:hypothetical protein B4100_3299 [Heyndrickxia coagulans]|nr:hypothetical protein B4100_3299 [Heyndrickxia coagulans]
MQYKGTEHGLQNVILAESEESGRRCGILIYSRRPAFFIHNFIKRVIWYGMPYNKKY